jgi:hypothetical protein
VDKVFVSASCSVSDLISSRDKENQVLGELGGVKEDIQGLK